MKYLKLKNFIKLSKKAQAFEAYRLLIAFVLALAFLVVIYSMVQSINEKSLLISNQKFKDGIISATKAVGISTKKEFVIDDLLLSGTISTRKLENYSGIDKECFKLVPGPGFKEDTASNILNIQGKFKKMNVYTYCDFEDAPITDDEINEYHDIIYDSTELKQCPVYCVIFFNKKPNVEYIDD
jgi:hypothetical protein